MVTSISYPITKGKKEMKGSKKNSPLHTIDQRVKLISTSRRAFTTVTFFAIYRSA